MTLIVTHGQNSMHFPQTPLISIAPAEPNSYALLRILRTLFGDQFRRAPGLTRSEP
jgi:hypothetical protein